MSCGSRFTLGSGRSGAMSRWMKLGQLMALSFVTLCGVRMAAAQNTGSLTGRVTDASSGQPVPGVTIVAQGPQGEQAELTDTDGLYTITGLTPGMYVVRFYYTNV